MDPVSFVASIVTLIQLTECIAKGCNYYVTRVKDAKGDIARLLQEVKSLSSVLESLKALIQGSKGRKLSVTHGLFNDLESCSSILTKLEARISPETRKKGPMRIWGLRVLKWPLKRLELEKSVNDLERVKATFALALGADQVSHTVDIDHKITFSQLDVAKGATFDAYGNENDECLRGTRVELLRELEDWANSPDGKCIFWLNGRAGTGKSTISRTIASRLQKTQLLGASFFFKRGEDHRLNAQRLFPTLVQQLVGKIPQLVPGVQKAIEEDNHIAEKALREQFEKLILRPLQDVAQNPATTLVVVIDALDECEREDDIRILLRLLPRVQTVNTVRLRFLLTGRPELPIRLGFREIDPDHQDLILHDIPEDVIERDIALFLRHRLLQLRRDRMDDISFDWPGENNIKALVKMSVPLFIFAATVYRMLQDPQWHPDDSLKDVLSRESRDSQIDQTYLPVLNRLFVNQNSKKTKKLTEEYRRVIGTLLVLQTPLPVDSLSILSSISKASMHQRLNSLHSVLAIPEDEKKPVRLFHLSFRDFLLDVDTRDKTPLWIDEQEAHRHLATQCLIVMRDGLRENICHLSSYGTLRSEIDPYCIQHYLKLELQYSCRFWASHLLSSCSGDPPDKDDGLLEAFEFLKEHLLHWIEAMCILGSGSKIVGIIANLQSVPQTGRHPDLSKFLYDAGRFMLRNRYISDTAPLQIYASGLTFAPRTSITRAMFKDNIPKWIQGAPNVEDSWTTLIQTLQGHSDSVFSVAFSPDGQLLASGGDDGTVKLWDPTTGELRQTLTGHGKSIYSVAFSPKILASSSHDGTIKLWEPFTGELQRTLEDDDIGRIAFSPHGLLAGASGSTIKVWNPATGELQQTLLDHGDEVTSVAFSHELLASGSKDKTVKLWDPVTGRLRYTLDGHTEVVTCVTFSSGGLLASGARDATVKLWKPETGELQQTLPHRASVCSVAFAPDGLTLVSWAVDIMIRVWNLSTGELQNAIKCGDGQFFTSAAFSPTNQLLATGSSDWNIRLWDPTIKYPIEIIGPDDRRHTVHAMAFSPDSQLLASGSTSGTIRLWDPLLGKARWSSTGHSENIISVAFSADSQVLASGSRDQSIILWSVTTGAQLHKWLAHDDWVDCLEFSLDGNALASSASDQTTRLWDLTTDKPQLILTINKSTHSVAFSPDGRRLAAAGIDKTVNLWNVATGKIEQILEGHTAHVGAVAFSPESDCQLLATGSKNEIRVWDTVNSHLLHTFPVDSDTYSLTFSKIGLFQDTKTERFCIQELHRKDSVTTIAATSAAATTTPLSRIPERCAYVYAPEDQWVCLQGQTVLYLPIEYRFFSTAMTTNIVALGDRSEVIFISLP